MSRLTSQNTRHTLHVNVIVRYVTLRYATLRNVTQLNSTLTQLSTLKSRLVPSRFVFDSQLIQQQGHSSTTEPP